MYIIHEYSLDDGCEMRNAWYHRVLKRHCPWWCHQMETFAALLALCARNSPVTGEFPSQRPVTRRFEVFFGLRLKNGWVNNRDPVMWLWKPCHLRHPIYPWCGAATNRCREWIHWCCASYAVNSLSHCHCVVDGFFTNQPVSPFPFYFVSWLSNILAVYRLIEHRRPLIVWQ